MDEFPPIRAIVLDLDGTLLNSSKMISDRNREAIRKCSERGIHLIVATARPPRAIDHLTEDLKFVEHVVYYNGALVVNKNKGIRRHTPIPAELSIQIVHYVSTDSPDTFVTYEVDDSWYSTAPLPGTGALGNSSIIDLGDRTLVFDTTQSLAAAVELRARHGTVRR